MKFIKKILIILMFIILIICIVLVTDYFTDSIGIINKLPINVFNNKDSLNYYHEENSKSFNPINLEDELVKKEYSRDYRYVPLTSNNKIVHVPIPDEEILNTYKDTIYSKEGIFYIALSKSNDSLYNDTDTIIVEEHNLGKDRPVILEVKLPKDNTIVYIQCYTKGILEFYLDYNWNDLKYTDSEYDLDINNILVENIKIDNSIIPNIKDMYLKEEYIEVTNKYRDDFEGYNNFNEFKNISFNYYRTVGYLNDTMKIEYARLMSLGYTPIEYGVYKDIKYIKFKDFTVLGSYLTENSSLIYYITE